MSSHSNVSRFWQHERRLAEILDPSENSFGLVRLLAALAVVVSHNSLVHSGFGARDLVEEWTGFTLGKHAVHVFFVLSGLLVSLSLARSRTLADYAMSRCLRIFPGFVACVVLMAIVVGPLVSALPVSDYFRSSEVISYVAKIVALVTAQERLPGVFPFNPYPQEVNLSLWTIKYEVFCYGLLALISALGLAATRGRATFVFGAIIGLIIASYGVPDLVPKGDTFDNIRRFVMCFSLGALAFANRDRIRLSPKMVLVALVCASAAYGTRFAVPVLLLVTAYATLVLAAQNFGAATRWTERTDLSFGIYLWGWPVSQIIMQLWPDAALWQLHIASLVLVVVLAFASWRIVERPALDLRKALVSQLRPGKLALAA